MFFQSVKKILLRPVSLMIVSTVICLGLAEGYIRMFINLDAMFQNPWYRHSLRQNPPYYGWDKRCGVRLSKNFPAELVPSKADLQGGTLLDLEVTNSIGIRDLEPPGDPNTRLAIILGDSMTYGWGAVNLYETWPRALTEVFRGSGSPWNQFWFMNAGVSGHNTYQEICLLELLLEDLEKQGKKPELVVLSFFRGIWERNLWGRDGMGTTEYGILMSTRFKRAMWGIPYGALGTHLFDSPHRQLLHFSQLYLLASIRYIQWLGLEVDYTGYAFPNYDGNRLYECNRQAFADLRAVLDRHGIRGVVTYLPEVPSIGQPKPESTLVIAHLQALSAEFNFPFVNPTQNLETRITMTYGTAAALHLAMMNGSSDSHLGREGNRLYAEALAPLLMKNITTVPIKLKLPSLE